MTNYCSENERVKRDYTLYLEAANGRQSPTADAALRAIDRFETSTNRKPFKRFHIEQARSFRADLAEALGPAGKPLSAATVSSTLKHLRNFFLWLFPGTGISFGDQRQRRRALHADRSRFAHRFRTPSAADRDIGRNQAGPWRGAGNDTCRAS